MATVLKCRGAKPVYRKIVVVGDGACGKTSLLNVFVKGYFPQIYEPTVFENYVHETNINGKTLELSLWDTAGQEEYDRLRSLSYADTHVIMLCFSVDNRDSLENCSSKWMKEILQQCPGVKVVLVALKCDLREDEATMKSMARFGDHPVTYTEGVTVARNINAMRYLECSAMHNRGVHECFEQSALVALQAKAKGGNEVHHKQSCLIV
ncbi:uncharacterized protein VTP21DRAFT_8274 [Calcarisporiella thermophila]|uniref:uncharacterized protein n=1 Tax=Calcarisporiella thermophila TaxID=911321 RepID=UPI003744A7B2